MIQNGLLCHLALIFLATNAFGQSGQTVESVLRFLPDNAIAVAGFQPSRVLSRPEIQGFLEATSLRTAVSEWDLGIGQEFAVRPSNIEQVVVVLDHSTLLAAIHRERESARQLQYSNQLKNLGLAMLVATDADGRFIDDDGPRGEFKGNLSWRVWLLPHLGESELFDQFHLNEPWDSEHNKTLVSKMPSVYASSDIVNNGTTSIHVFSGKGSPFHGQNPPSPHDIDDGPESTILLVMAGSDKADFWTKPGGLDFDVSAPRSSLGEISRKFLICRMDAAVHALPFEISEQTLLGAIQHSDGTSIDMDELIGSIPKEPSVPLGIIVRSTMPVDQQRMTETLKNEFGESQSGQINGTSALIFQTCVAVFADDRTLLIGVKDLVERMLADRHSVRTGTEAFATRFPDNDVALTVDVAELRKAVPFLEKTWLSGFESINHVTFVTDLTGEGKSLVELEVNPVDPSRISAVSDVVDGALGILSEYLTGLTDGEDAADDDPLQNLIADFGRRKSIVNDRMVHYDIPKPADVATFLNELDNTAAHVVESIRRTKSEELRTRNLKRLGQACLDYCLIYDCLPSALGYHGVDHRKTCLSWRVHLLPELGYADLYSQFHLDEPWDSEHNKTLISSMPEEFKVPDVNEDGYTSIQAIIGTGTSLGSDRPVRLKEIVDGHSTTIMFVEVGKELADVWTKPGGIPFDPDAPGNGVGSMPLPFFAVMCDGLVKRLGSEVDDATLKAIIQINEGTIVGLD